MIYFRTGTFPIGGFGEYRDGAEKIDAWMNGWVKNGFYVKVLGYEKFNDNDSKQEAIVITVMLAERDGVAHSDMEDGDVREPIN